MTTLYQSLLNAEPLDLAEMAARWGGDLPHLSHLRRCSTPEGTLLDSTQALMDALLEHPPPDTCRGRGAVLRPWWSAMPAAYLAAFVRYAGVPNAYQEEDEATAREQPLPLEARQVLRALGIPFAQREHAVQLLANLDASDSLPASGAPAEAYLKLACSLDCRALYWLKHAELSLRTDRDDRRWTRLEAFREELQQHWAFGRPRPPALDACAVADLGYADPRCRHRAQNALRYFELVAGMNEPEWYAERLRKEGQRPACRLNILVGPAACGKTSWAERELADTVIISSDRMREQLTGDPADQSQNYLVFQRCMDRAREALRRGEQVTFDATNYDERLREMPVQAGRWAGAEIVTYLFDVSYEECLRRNRGREREVPEQVIHRHFRRMEPPTLYEADRHRLVRSDGSGELYWPER